MRAKIFGLMAAVSILPPGAWADESADPADPMWKMASCTNPSLSYPVKRKRLSGEVRALFDISADGDVENIRITAGGHDESMADYVTRALTRWRYFGYIENGELAPRKDVAITFTYGPEKDKPACTHTSLPELPSTLGDPADPFQSLLQCQELIMPAKAARWKTEGHVKVRYDISPEGMVSNIEILAAEPKDRFVADAKNMLDSWKYEEFLKAGEAIARPGMIVDFHYGELPEDANGDRCVFAPWDATQKVIRRRTIG